MQATHARLQEHQRDSYHIPGKKVNCKSHTLERQRTAKQLETNCKILHCHKT